ncbi:disease resistance protein RPV1-like isoform X3 [Rhodamnia argentea]|uniref:Disease resistance protein RPV1-like isoform X3 n=1 Tax=Rhodamnia argentea TaxID=178133 RepID=A0ABM3H9V6_9MYRT|nr:disease resistance protein RPV1-like isoform X3 [Rhodamnia argentea]
MEDQPKQSSLSVPGASSSSTSTERSDSGPPASDDIGQETSDQQQQVLSPRHERAKGKAPFDSLEPAMEDRQPKQAKLIEASSSSISVIVNNYYIFLSFRGADTRNGFVDHLYHKLQEVGLPLHPNFELKDENDHPWDLDFGKKLISAIRHSKVSIPVISETYAASELCLRELIEIMACKKTGGQIVLPVFYKVKPHEVRDLEGAFGEAFRSRRQCFEWEDVEQKGPEALQEVVDSRTFESEKLTRGREAELVNKLIERIRLEQQHDSQPHLPVNSVEIEDTEVSRSSTSPEGSNSGPSASSTSVIGNNYYIFLSFRGPDTRSGFVDHLYHRLQNVGLKFHPNFVFRDDNDLAFGKDIGNNLTSAIKQSKFLLPVISEKYASSEWCLRELIDIMDCKESNEQIILPVFYKVKPYEVRELMGNFGKAFEERKHRFKMEDVKEKGPEALRKVADLRTFESEKFESGHEGKLVEELVKIITDELRRDFPHPLPADLVGFDNHVAEVTRLADTASSEVQNIVIYGIGGIGKTTLATHVYHKLLDDFKYHSFIKDTRETIQSKGIVHVQSRLLSDMTDTIVTVPDPDRGINMIRAACAKKVLILLDDVACQDHIDKLIGGCNFGAGSRIIITCRDKDLLKPEYKGYELTEMNMQDALLLFRKYAFKGEQTPIELVTLSSDIVATTGRIPLALVIIGSFLNRKDKSIWTETLEKLKKVPHIDVQQKLRISYESLGYEEQQMFLDIACFFIGIDKRIVAYLWKDLHYRVDSGFKRMMELSLMKVDDNNELRMHDHLRDLGRAIARPAHKKLWKCSRLWDEEAITVQRSEKENTNIEALSLDENGSSMFMKRKSFKKMPYLKFLHMSEVEFDEDDEDSLSELRWLEWKSCPDSVTVANVHLGKLVILNLSGGSISENWGGWTSITMERLKVLNLSKCSALESTPKLSKFQSLEMLILENCDSLAEIDPSIGDVKRLVSLNLRYCGSLQVLPAQLGELRELEELLVDETDIQEIPECIGSLVKLKTLSAVGCRLLTRVPSSLRHLVNLLTLNMKNCKILPQLLDSFQALGGLQRLSLEYCCKLGRIPPSIAKLGELFELDLSHTIIDELPESMGELKKLKILRISHSKIKKLPRAIGELKSLQELHASGCSELEGQIPREISGLSSLKTLRLGGKKISGLPENFRELSSLENLNLLGCEQLQSLPEPPSRLSSLQLTCRSDKLPSLSHLTHLKELTLDSCMSLQSIPELPSCIWKLRVQMCPNLEKLSILPEWNSLSELELLQCYGLKELDGLEALTSLRMLNLSISTDLSDVNNFDNLDRVSSSDTRSFVFKKVDNLHVIGGLEKLGSLEVLNICERKHIARLNLSKSEHLRQLIVNNCQRLIEIRFHDKIESLERFERDGCPPQITTLQHSTGHRIACES